MIRASWRRAATGARPAGRASLLGARDERPLPRSACATKGVADDPSRGAATPPTPLAGATQPKTFAWHRMKNCFSNFFFQIFFSHLNILRTHSEPVAFQLVNDNRGPIKRPIKRRHCDSWLKYRAAFVSARAHSRKSALLWWKERPSGRRLVHNGSRHFRFRFRAPFVCPHTVCVCVCLLCKPFSSCAFVLGGCPLNKRPVISAHIPLGAFAFRAPLRCFIWCDPWVMSRFLFLIFFFLTLTL